MVEQAPKVTKLIASRIKNKSKPWNREDPWKLGLVVEGGAMRAVISGGMGSGLQSLDAFLAFDATFGVSAGAGATFYLASGRAPEGTAMFYRQLNTKIGDKEFINFRRFLIGKPIVDIPYMVYELMTNTDSRMGWQAVVSSPIPLHTYVTRAEDTSIIDLWPTYNIDQAQKAVELACGMPVVAAYPMKYGDFHYTDGSVLTGGIAIEQSLNDECTHVLVLLTRPDGTKGKNAKIHDKLIIALLRRRFPVLADNYLLGFKNYKTSLAKIRQLEYTTDGLPMVEAISPPSWRPEIQGLEKSREVLIQGAQDGYDAVMAKFAPFNLPVNEKVRILV